jgi:hypothetical protein
MSKTVGPRSATRAEIYPPLSHRRRGSNPWHTTAEVRAALTRALVDGDRCRSDRTCAHASTVADSLEIVESTVCDYFRADPAIVGIDAMDAETLNPIRAWTFTATHDAEEAGDV